VVIELVIAIFFKIKIYKLIIKVNILTQILLHLILVLTFYNFDSTIWYIEFYILEISIVFIEFFFYKSYIKNYNLKKLFIYSVVANITTFIFGLIV